MSAQWAAVRARRGPGASLEVVAPLVSRLLRSFRLRRPVSPVLVPSWDLPTVLRGLQLPPFEPLLEADLLWLSAKVAFFLAITSARRLGELGALLISFPYLQFLQDRVIWRLDTAFLPKVSSSFRLQQEVILPDLPTDGDSLVPPSLDVRRALQIYLQRSLEFRVSPALFVSCGGVAKGKKVSTSTISRWVRLAVCQSYKSLELPPPSQVQGRSTHSVSVSWAEAAGDSIHEICRAPTWHSHHTFVRHYRLDVLHASADSFSVGVLHAALH